MELRSQALWRVVLLLVANVLVFPAVAQEHAGKKVAFVVGVNRYDSVGSLRTAENDAVGVSNALRRHGFKVFEFTGVNRSSFWRSWDGFLKRVSPEDIVVFYFAGHGVQIEQENFLLPSDAPDASVGVNELKSRSIAVSELFKSLEALPSGQPKVRLFILDACRNNPYSGNLRSIGSRGLAKPPLIRGTFVMYSADANEVAFDRLGDDDLNPNSVYTRHLLRYLGRPGTDLLQIAKRVQAAVHADAKSIDAVQTPAYYDSVVGYFCLSGCDEGRKNLASALEVITRAADDVRKHYVPQADPHLLLSSAFDAVVRKYGLGPLPSNVLEAVEQARASKEPETFFHAFRAFQPTMEQAISVSNNITAHAVAMTAINGMYETLDQHSFFVDPERYAPSAFTERGAIGVEFKQEFGRLTVTKLVLDGPADAAGLKEGDHVTHIDGQSVAGLGEGDVLARLRGEVGSAVTLSVIKDGSIQKVRAIRSDERPSDVEVRILVPQEIAVLKIRNFGISARVEANRLKDQSKHLILDLRRCEDGDLSEASEFVRILATSPAAWRINKSSGLRADSSSDGDGQFSFNIRANTATNLKSLDVLIGSRTSGAAELVAALLRKSASATLWGERTAGKGSVQRLFHYGADGSSRITIGRINIADEAEYDRVGVMPDEKILTSSASEDEVLRAVLERRRRTP